MSSIGPKFILEDRFIFHPTSNSLVDKEAEDEMVRLGSNESRILLMLSQHPNEVISRNELHDFVWREQGFEVDDSSLTQAISTLRKNLHDSTKSPRFVKTVPKRGYQLICNVAILSEHTDDQLELTDSLAHESADTDALYDTTSVVSLDAPHEGESVVEDYLDSDHEFVSSHHHEHSSDKNDNNKPVSPLAKIALVIAILVPIFALILVSPTKAKLRHITDIDGIKVNAPINQPELSSWLPSIRHCVDTYSKNHSGEYQPIEVIATGGNDNILVLNYIHQPKHSSQNFTVKILADQHDLSQICQ